MGGVTLRQRYDSKVEECKKRMIPFKFSFAEWKVLFKLRNKVKCAYSNKDFNLKKGHHNNPTLERISERPDVGYCVGNVVWATRYANTMRNEYISLEQSKNLLNSKERGFVHRIEKILGCQENIDRILEPYTEAFNELKKTKPEQKDNVVTETKEIEMTEQEIANEVENLEDVYTGNSELVIAKTYVEVGELLEQAGARFELTFNQFKLRMARKTCEITGREFVEGDVKTFYLISKDLPYRKDTVLLTTVKMQKALDTFLMDTDIDMFELKKLGDKLGMK